MRPPMPGECHPRFEPHRRELLHWLDETTDPYRLLLEVTEIVGTPFMEREYKRVALTRRKVFAWAPFVGKPFGYMWHVGMADNETGISGTNVRNWDIESGPLWNAWLTADDEEEDDDQ
jgi:hypothetical protein